ncbi:DNA-directed RNA polymerase subunit H [Candidatus Woesearchaeota archaeon]|nr:DNA-directed RNA polymerase subunit H [Candidatus Woesearchaeota archaeon]
MAKRSKALEHELVPKHELLSQADKEKLLEKYSVSVNQLPQISKNDAAISHLDVTAGDIIKITRKSSTAGSSVFFRVVTDE